MQVFVCMLGGGIMVNGREMEKYVKLSHACFVKVPNIASYFES